MHFLERNAKVKLVKSELGLIYIISTQFDCLFSFSYSPTKHFHTKINSLRSPGENCSPLYCSNHHKVFTIISSFSTILYLVNQSCCCLKINNFEIYLSLMFKLVRNAGVRKTKQSKYNLQC